MKPSYSLLLTLALAACSSAPIQPPTATSLPPKAATLVAATPSLEVTFDGSNCAITGETPLSLGEHVFLLHNASPQRSLLITGRLYGDRRWEDFLQWFEDHCGTPGSICDRTGEAPWISWLFETASAEVGSEQRYFQYALDQEGEYFLVASWLDGSVWPCGTFRVGASE
jgi:hypothetical protein